MTNPGPMLLVELPTLPGGDWRPDPMRRYLVGGRLLTVEPVGCMVCAATGLPTRTLCAADSDEYVCVAHGPLRVVPYQLRRTWTAQIGEVVRSGEHLDAAVVLFPASLPAHEVARVINEMIDDVLGGDCAGRDAHAGTP